MLKNEMESYVTIGGRGLKYLTYPYMGVEGVKNCQNHPYVINEWSLAIHKKITGTCRIMDSCFTCLLDGHG